MPLFYHKYVNYVLAHSVNYVITLYSSLLPLHLILPSPTTIAKPHYPQKALSLLPYERSVGFASLRNSGRSTSGIHARPLSKVRCCRPKKFGRLPEGLLPIRTNPPKTSPSLKNRHRPCLLMNVPFVLHLHYPARFSEGERLCVLSWLCVHCNRGRLRSVRHCLVSHLCRCIVQRLSVTDFMHPCIPTFCDHL